jgi:hypothetical protein
MRCGRIQKNNIACLIFLAAFIVFVVLVASGVIFLVLAAFGYNFLAAWFYAVGYYFVLLIAAAFMYAIILWWRNGGDLKTIPPITLVGFVFLGATILLFLVGDFFLGSDLLVYFGYICAYSAFLCFSWQMPRNSTEQVALVLLFTCAFALRTIVTFPQLLSLGADTIDDLQVFMTFTQFLVFFGLPLWKRFIRQKQQTA